MDRLELVGGDDLGRARSGCRGWAHGRCCGSVLRSPGAPAASSAALRLSGGRLDVGHPSMLAGTTRRGSVLATHRPHVAHEQADEDEDDHQQAVVDPAVGISAGTTRLVSSG